MSKDARGKKRHCKACGAKFYDLGRKLGECAKCGAPLDQEKKAEKTPEPPAAAKAVGETEVVKSETSTEGPEFISLEEAEAAESGTGAVDGPEIEDEEAIAELDDDDADIPDDEDDDTFLEEEDDAEPAVEDIIGAAIESED